VSAVDELNAIVAVTRTATTSRVLSDDDQRNRNHSTIGTPPMLDSSVFALSVLA
jgi:hypothetical protein